MVLTQAEDVSLAMSDEMRDMFYIPISFVSITMLICIFVTLVLATIQLGLGSLILLARKKQLDRSQAAQPLRQLLHLRDVHR